MTSQTIAPLAVRRVAAGYRIDVRVTARAGRTAVTGVRDGRLHVRVAAAPVDGAANEALIQAVAAALGVAPRDVRVVIGEHSRQKTIEVAVGKATDASEIARRLSEATA